MTLTWVGPFEGTIRDMGDPEHNGHHDTGKQTPRVGVSGGGGGGPEKKIEK